MDVPVEVYDNLLRSAARRLTGHQRRLFEAEVADALCQGSPRAAERRFGFCRDTVATGQHEARSGIRCVEDFVARGKLPAEVKDPQLAADIRAIVEPHTLADPEMKSARRYSNLSAREERRNPYPSDSADLDDPLADDYLRFGVQFADGRKATTLDDPPTTQRAKRQTGRF